MHSAGVCVGYVHWAHSVGRRALPLFLSGDKAMLLSLAPVHIKRDMYITTHEATLTQLQNVSYMPPAAHIQLQVSAAQIQLHISVIEGNSLLQIDMYVYLAEHVKLLRTRGGRE